MKEILIPVAAVLCMACASEHYAIDEAITQEVVRGLIQEDKINLTRVDVQTNEGTVYLTGEVQNRHQKERAEEIARSMQGVRHVVNKLELQP